MRIPFLLLSLFLLCSPNAYSQEHGDVFRYARKIVDTLASPSMHGRGYVNDGDKIAANYLEEQFVNFGLKKFAVSYRQEFYLPVNTYPGILQISIDDKKLIPGKDYIISGGGAISSGKYKIIWCDTKDPYKSLHNKPRQKKAIIYSDTLLKTWEKEEKRETEPLPKKGLFDYYEKQYEGKNCTLKITSKLTWEVPNDTTNIKIQILEGVLSLNSKKLTVSIETKLIPDYQTQNLIGYISGTQYPDSFIVFTAHYDHLGQMGKDTYFPGANDNASGCAMLLNLARYYSMPEHKPKYSIAFMAFSGEEAGLVGSKYYVEHPLFPLKQIKFLVNMDIMGTGDEGVTVVNGTIYPEAFKTLQAVNEKGHFLTEVKIRGKAANSDHYFFSENGVPAFFIYTRGGIKAYHDIYDKAATLPLTKFEDVFRLLTGFEEQLETH
jgi:aminopeptidase YwaD